MSSDSLGYLKYLFLSFLFISAAILRISTFYPNNSTVTIFIEKISSPVHVVDEEFISFGIDTVEILSENFRSRLKSPKLRNLTKLLSPSRLRFGGTYADRLIFTPNERHSNNVENLPYFTINAEDLLLLFNFTQDVGSKMLFTLNVLLRSEKGWDPSNAIDIMDFCHANRLPVDWQLGNEPNSFKHVFNVTVSPDELSDDFKELKKLITRHSPDSLLVGPDTTRPQPKRPDCIRYMKEFLSKSAKTIDAIGWHQYYLNGRTATLEDFWDLDTLELLHSQINTMDVNIAEYRRNLPMWLTETGSAYGGGAPNLSNSYAATSLWLDKLGLAARSGINVVIRQSLIGANYSLIDEKHDPLPDWWIAYIHKFLVGKEVLKCSSDVPEVRVYCHCTADKYLKALSYNNSLTAFAINLSPDTKLIHFQGAALNTFYNIEEYVITPLNNDRLSKFIKINGKIPTHDQFVSDDIVPNLLLSDDEIEMPPFSLAFWVLHNVTLDFCSP